MKRMTGAAILVLLLSSAGSLDAEAAGGSVARTTVSNSPVTARASDGMSSSVTSKHATDTVSDALCHGEHTPPSSSNLALMDAATTCLINRERTRYGLRPLRPNSVLQKVAGDQATEMVIGDYFGDDSMTGMTPMQRIAVSHYAWRVHSLRIGQNIGWGTGTLATPQAMVEGWMDSPPHREIILTAGYRNIGSGIAPSAPPALADGMRGATYSVELAVRH